MSTLDESLRDLCSHSPQKIVISKPATASVGFQKLELVWMENGYFVSKYTSTQVFHETIPHGALSDYCAPLLQAQYLQLNSWSDDSEHMLLIAKSGRITYKTKRCAPESLPKRTATHNREKNYIIPDGVVVPPLVDMGIFTKDGKVVSAMYDKFRQINRFIELVDDAVKGAPFRHLNIVDFGCGKSYLTFILYYYFTEIRKLPVHIVGLDLKADVIEKCNAAARKYGYTDLHFELGDISGYRSPIDVDMVISLHACDTATDYALYHAVLWNAKLIFSVPCCQHELGGQVESDPLSLLTRYGIVKERFSALATDAIRGGLLEAYGYKTQLLEFVDFAHTPKNILIRAVRKNASLAARTAALQEVERLMEVFSFRPTLYQLLKRHPLCGAQSSPETGSRADAPATQSPESPAPTAVPPSAPTQGQAPPSRL